MCGWDAGRGTVGVIIIIIIIIILTTKPKASGRGETMCNFSQDFWVYSYYYCQHYQPSYPKT